MMENIGLPKGVINLVNGGKNAVNALLDHPKVRAISFVGRPRWRGMSMPVLVNTGSARNVRAARRTTSSYCRTPI